MNPDQIPDLNKYTHGITQAIRFGTVIQSLKQTQYKIRNYSIFDVDDQPAYYSVFPSIPVGFLNGIVESSILNMIIYDLSMKMRLYGIHTEVLANITEAARSSDQRPMFVYAHLLAPHPPFVIDSTGREIHFFSQSQNNANTAAYVEQVKGLNKLVFSTVGDILDISPEAIIIVMGDHGYRYLSSEARDEEAFTVFLAYHGPNSESLESLTNSNQIFKLVFRGLE